MDKLSDDDFLGIVQRERQQSVGFEHDAVLTADRTRALEYAKGVMKDMVPVGSTLCVETSRVWSTGTTATLIVGLR